MDINGYTQQEAANALTPWGAGLIVGCTLWGYVADRVVKTRKGVIYAGALVYMLLWVVLAVKLAGLPRTVLHVAMFWGGFFASTWIPAYAQLKEAVPPQVVATGIEMLNLFFWLGGAFYQQASGLLLEASPTQAGHISVAGYQTVFWLCVGSVGVSVILAACSTEQRRPRRSG